MDRSPPLSTLAFAAVLLFALFLMPAAGNGHDVGPLRDGGVPEATGDPPMVGNLTATLSAGLADVELRWDAPTNLTGVINLVVYAGAAFEADGQGYAPLGELTPTETAFTHVGAGAGSADTFYYQVRTNSSLGSNAPPVQAAKLGRSLPAGTSLAGLPIIPADPAVDVVLQSVLSDLGLVRTYDPTDAADAWKRFSPVRGGDLFVLSQGSAFWLDLDAPATLALTGSVPTSTTLSLSSGWNLVTLPAANAMPVQSALAGLPYTEVEGFDPASPPYHLRSLGPTDLLEPAVGFWVELDTPADWLVGFDVGLPTLPLSQVETWAYQIQKVNEPGVEDALANSSYDMLVLEPTRTDWSSSDRDFDTRALVDRLKGTLAGDGLHRKLVLAYVDIGEAEDWRWYWTWSQGWDCTGPKPSDYPDYIVTCDPDGWTGNYPVAYWDAGWKDVVIYGQNQSSDPYGNYVSALDEVVLDGFDGIYMDWVEAYENPDVAAAAAAAGLDPAVAMVDLIAEIRAYAQARNPDFLVIQQNAAQLGAVHPELFAEIDAVAQEAIWFDGDATDVWGDPAGYDIPVDPALTAEYLANLAVYQTAGLPVFNCEYAVVYAHDAYNNSLAQGFVPYVSQRSLSTLSTTPPPSYPPDLTPGVEHHFVYRGQNVIYYIPLAYLQNPTETRIFFGIHGNGRTYQTHFDRWMNLDVPEQHNVVLIVPHWDLVTFERYQRLNVGYGVRADLRLIELFDHFNAWLGFDNPTFFMYGFSAGGQFTHRFAFTHPEYIDRAVAGGSGTYMFPDPSVPWGHGMDLSAHEPIDLTIQLEAAYQRNVAIIIGLNDTLRDSGLSTSTLSDAQGLNRLERARNFWANHTAVASANAWPFVWHYEEVPDVGHSSTQIRPIAVEYLFGGGLGPKVDFQTGFGNFTYFDDGDNADRPVNVYYYRPANFPSVDSKVVFTMHGSARDAVSARDRIVPYADRYNALLIAPEFSRDYYPDADDYNRGFVKDGGGTGNLRARSDWTLLTIEELFDIVQASIVGGPSTYSIQGNSGAGQFISRLPLLVPEGRFDVVAGSNSGWYTLPIRSEVYPNGIGDLDITDAQIEQMYSKKVVVTVGELDTDPNSYQLKHNAFTDAQGNNRYERALFYHDYMGTDAANRGVPYNWDLRVVENVGHPAELMAHATAGAVFAHAYVPSMSLAPLDDTYIDEANPSSVFGGGSELQVDGGNQEITFLKFDLSAVPAPVGAALLKFYVTNGADGQQFVHEVVDNTWSEASLTWDAAPALGPQIGMTTGGERDGILYIEVTDYINARIGGLASLAIQSWDTDQIYFSSRETTSFPARLVLFNGSSSLSQPPESIAQDEPHGLGDAMNSLGPLPSWRLNPGVPEAANRNRALWSDAVECVGD